MIAWPAAGRPAELVEAFCPLTAPGRAVHRDVDDAPSGRRRDHGAQRPASPAKPGRPSSRPHTGPASSSTAPAPGTSSPSIPTASAQSPPTAPPSLPRNVLQARSGLRCGNGTGGRGVSCRRSALDFPRGPRTHGRIIRQPRLDAVRSAPQIARLRPLESIRRTPLTAVPFDLHCRQARGKADPWLR
jgi:hypothetical protein